MEYPPPPGFAAVKVINLQKSERNCCYKPYFRLLLEIGVPQDAEL